MNPKKLRFELKPKKIISMTIFTILCNAKGGKYYINMCIPKVLINPFFCVWNESIHLYMDFLKSMGLKPKTVLNRDM